MSYQDSSERFNITSNRHHDVYPIDPRGALKDSCKGKSVLVTGAGRGIRGRPSRKHLLSPEPPTLSLPLVRTPNSSLLARKSFQRMDQYHWHPRLSSKSQT
ncbi:hypothetical protein C8Q72DRAFT_443713 [Fomitopsis betulina]|nr:hypothetical protein C8Q72DRAFT_443713 [Fomitopsis betulina]